MSNLIAHSTSPIGLAVHSNATGTYQTLAESIQWLNEQATISGLNNVVAIELFWEYGMTFDPSQWNQLTAWNYWNIYAGNTTNIGNFGYTTIGTAYPNYESFAGYFFDCKFTLNSTQTFTSLSLYLNQPSATGTFYMYITGTDKVVLRYTVEGNLASGLGWQTLNLTSPITLNTGTYCIGFMSSVNAHLYYDNGSTNQQDYWSGASYLYPPTTTIPVSMSNNFVFSIYATYTENTVSQVANQLWVTYASDFNNNSSTVLAAMDAANCTMIMAIWGPFFANGSIYHDNWSTNAELKTLINTCKAHNPNIKVLAWVASGQNTIRVMDDLSTSNSRNAYKNAIINILNTDLGNSTYFDGISLDCEDPWDNQGYPIATSNLNTFYQLITSTCHTASNFHDNEVKFVHNYYGVRSWAINDANDISTLESLDCDLAIIRFYPLTNVINNQYQEYKSTWSDAWYQMILDHVNCPWGCQIRAATDNTEDENPALSTSFLTSKFNIEGVPSLYAGSSFYHLKTNNNGLTVAEWNILSNWEYVDNNTPEVYYTISASSDAHTTLYPNGSVQVLSGNNQIFNYSAASGYFISSVLVDGNAVSITGNYTFTNVNTNHTIYISSSVVATGILINGIFDPAIFDRSIFDILQNLAPFSTDWITDNPWGFNIPALNIFIESNITNQHNGEFTVRIDPSVDTTNSAFDFWKIDVQPNDHVIMKCWVKTAGTYVQDWMGARINFDWFGGINNQRITDGHIFTGTSVITGATYDGYVHYGNNWTLVTWDFIVPATVAADGATGGFAVGEQVIPSFFVPWCQIWGWGSTPALQYPNGAASAWFSGMEIYVNPLELTTGFLHTSGTQLLDNNNQSVILTGWWNSIWKYYLDDGNGNSKLGSTGCLSLADFQRIADNGGNVIRINELPWDSFEPSQGNINPIQIGILDTLAEWALQTRVYLIISGGLDSSDSVFPTWIAKSDRSTDEVGLYDTANTNYNNVRAAYTNFMVYLANRYKNNPFIILELSNEPFNGNTISNNYRNYNAPSITWNNAMSQKYAATQSAIATAMHNVGYLNPVIIPHPWLNFYATVRTDFTSSNCVWDFHFYYINSTSMAQWQSDINGYISTYIGFGKPLIAGEWAYVNSNYELFSNLTNFQSIQTTIHDYLFTKSICGMCFYGLTYLYGGLAYIWFGPNTQTNNPYPNETVSNWLMSNIMIGGTGVPNVDIVIDPIPENITHISGQSGQSKQQNVNSLTITMSQTPVEGNTIIVVIGIADSVSNKSVSNITQTGVNWSTLGFGLQKSAQFSYVEFTSVEIWAGRVGINPSSILTITLNGIANTYAIANVYEYAGIALTNILDKTASNNTQGNNITTDSGTTITTTQTNELWIGGTACGSWGVNQTNPKNGFTLYDGVNYNYTGSSAFLEKIVSTVGIANSGCDVDPISGNNFAAVGVIATFKGIISNNPALLVQNARTTTNSGQTIIVNLNQQPVIGDLLVLTIVTSSQTSGIYYTINNIISSNITWDDGAISTVYDIVHGVFAEIWIGHVYTGAGQVITVNLSNTLTNGDASVVNVLEFSGVSISSYPVDKTANQIFNNSGAMYTNTGITATTSQANELLIGVVGTRNSLNQITPQNGYAIIDGINYSGGQKNATNATLFKIVSSTQQASSGTSADNGEFWGAIITLKCNSLMAEIYSYILIDKIGFFESIIKHHGIKYNLTDKFGLKDIGVKKVKRNYTDKFGLKDIKLSKPKKSVSDKISFVDTKRFKVKQTLKDNFGLLNTSFIKKIKKISPDKLSLYEKVIKNIKEIKKDYSGFKDLLNTVRTTRASQAFRNVLIDIIGFKESINTIRTVANARAFERILTVVIGFKESIDTVRTVANAQIFKKILTDIIGFKDSLNTVRTTTPPQAFRNILTDFIGFKDLVTKKIKANNADNIGLHDVKLIKPKIRNIDKLGYKDIISHGIKKLKIDFLGLFDKPAPKITINSIDKIGLTDLIAKKINKISKDILSLFEVDSGIVTSVAHLYRIILTDIIGFTDSISKKILNKNTHILELKDKLSKNIIVRRYHNIGFKDISKKITKKLYTDKIDWKYLSLDTSLANYTIIGRMSAIKTSVTNKLSIIIPKVTIIDPERLKLWEWNSYNGILVSLSITPSPVTPRSYGMNITQKYAGLYQEYKVNMYVFARHVDSDELEAYTVQNAVNNIVKYLRTNGQDLSSGVLYYDDKFNIRQVDPTATGGAHMACMIIECKLFAQRPFRVK
jgi:hypothetical protein